MKLAQELVAQPARLVESIAYQKDSIVSKTIIDMKTGTVTLFAFDQGQGLSEHTTAFDALVHILDGEAKVTISGKHVIVKEGDVIIMPANHAHSMQASERFKMLLVMIKS